MQITINGKACEFTKGEKILQVALRNDVVIPHYCYHPSMSIPASCRICLAECWAPNPKTGKLEAMPQLKPTCHTECMDGMVVSTESPRAAASQKSVMEFLLINHPVDCPVCDKAGECYLQDYSFEYGRGESRFLEEKVKNPKKDIGPDILLYSDRCIMCTRCVRFTREVTGTDELMVEGRGDREMIDVFPGRALDNPLARNVVDICPVGALLDKDFLFQQRVWFLTRTPSIDGLTASGDNIYVEHNDGVVHRIKPRTNMEVNTWWITDEVRTSWKHVHAEQRLRMPQVKGVPAFDSAHAANAWHVARAKTLGVVAEAVNARRRTALVVSPMLTCEDAFALATWLLAMDPGAMLAVGPVPFKGEDRVFKGGFKMYAEKAPNARGVKRVLAAVAAATRNRAADAPAVQDWAGFMTALRGKQLGAVVMTGNYPSDWVTAELRDAAIGTPLVLLDTLQNALCNVADAVLPAATWCEKDGAFQNATDRVQAFAQAIEPLDFSRPEMQIASDLHAAFDGRPLARVRAADIRARMASVPGLQDLGPQLQPAVAVVEQGSDMAFAQL
ncbi:MAG: molybdopterin-dependent oxidoreductase [Phycisphaerales bacterium]